MKINPGPEQIKQITDPGSAKFHTPGGTYYYVPMIFKVSHDGSWEKFSWNEVPEEIKNIIVKLRSKTSGTLDFLV